MEGERERKRERERERDDIMKGMTQTTDKKVHARGCDLIEREKE